MPAAAAEELASTLERGQQFVLMYDIGKIAALVSLIAWLCAAYGMLPRYGDTSVGFSRSRAIYAWFIPLFNLVLPYQVLRETWHGSAPPREGDESAHERARDWLPATFPAWLASWLAVLASSMFSDTWPELPGDTVSRSKMVLTVLGAAANLVFAVLSMIVIRQIHQRQMQRAPLVATVRLPAAASDSAPAE